MKQSLFYSVLAMIGLASNAFAAKQLDGTTINNGYQTTLQGYNYGQSGISSVSGWYTWLPYDKYYYYNPANKWGIYMTDRSTFAYCTFPISATTERDGAIHSIATSTDKLQNLLKSRFNWNSWDNKGSMVTVNLFCPPFPEAVFPNSRWDRTINEIDFNDFSGDPSFTSSYNCILKVTAHELMHGVTYSDAQHKLLPTAIAEGYADIFAVVAEKYLMGSTNWSVHERTLSIAPPKYDPYALIETHQEGLILGHAFYLLVNGGKDGNGISFSGIGFDKASLIAFRAITECTRNGEDWGDIVTSWIEAANDLGYGANISTIKAAFSVLGLFETPKPIVALNCGGAAINSKGGINYVSDQNFINTSKYNDSRTNTIAVAIAGTVDDNIYTTERYGTFSYRIPLANGNYTVVFQNDETYWNQKGQRQFSIKAEGISFSNNFDLLSHTDKNRAFDTQFLVYVKDGALDIDFLSGSADVAKICGVLIYRDTRFDPSKVVKAINCGSSTPITVYNGITYQSDATLFKPYGTTCNTGSTNEQTNGTIEDILYSTERWGDDFRYDDISLVPGNYLVRLHFSELYWTEDDRRTFQVSVESRTTQDMCKQTIDVHKEVGHDYAYDLIMPVKNERNSICIHLDGRSACGFKDFAKISAITIYKQ